MGHAIGITPSPALVPHIRCLIFERKTTDGHVPQLAMHPIQATMDQIRNRPIIIPHLEEGECEFLEFGCEASCCFQDHLCSLIFSSAISEERLH
jgi:hypothetical protein